MIVIPFLLFVLPGSYPISSNGFYHPGAVITTLFIAYPTLFIAF